MLDSLPVEIYVLDAEDNMQFTRGFPVGIRIGIGKFARPYFYHHVRIIISYHDDSNVEVADESPTQL